MAKKVETFYRIAAIEQHPNKVAGTVRLSFASEALVKRTDSRGEFWEVLSHAAGDANLGFLNRNGIVLENHDDQKEIGDVARGSARVEADKKTRADIHIHDGTWVTRAKNEPSEIPVSVGYSRLSLLRKEEDGPEGLQIRWYSWRPYEISLLTVAPADDSVGIGRSREEIEGELLTRSKTHRCGRCDGTGRCRCRAKEEDEADEDCPDCEGSGDCHECDGDGHFTSARSKSVDFEKLNDSEKQKFLKRHKLMAEKTEPTVDQEKIKREAAEATAKSYKERAKELTAVADAHIAKHGNRELREGDKVILLRDKLSALANEALQTDSTVPDFKVRCLEAISAAEPEKNESIRAKIGEEEMATFSLHRAIQSCVRKQEDGRGLAPDPKTFEGEVINFYREEVEAKPGGMGFDSHGFVVPWEFPIGNVGMSRKEAKSNYRKLVNQYGRDFLQQRDMQATVFGQGGAVVPTFWLLPVIELLRNKIVLSKVGMRTLSGLTGNVILPRLEAPSTAYSLAEIQAIANSQQTLGQLTATPHRVGNRVPYSKQLVFQSSPDIENLIRDDMMKVLALKWDALGIFGQGANSEPTGLFNQNGIGTITWGGAANYANTVLFETTIRQLNVMEALAYVTTSTAKGKMKSAAVTMTGSSTVVSGYDSALWRGVGQTGEEDGRLNGWPAIDSQQIPNNQMLAAAFEHFVHCLWAGIDIVVDFYTLAANAEVVVNMNTWGDFLLRHPQAVCISTDSSAQ
jgi:HK97 family phage major capsid protein